MTNWKPLEDLLRKVGSIVGLVVAIGNQAHLPVAVRTALVAVSGWLQVIEHSKGATPPTSGA